MADSVDTFLGQWEGKRPDLADQLWPMGIVGRAQRLAQLLERGMKEYFATYDLQNREVDVLFTLRRAGGTTGLTCGELIDYAMVTSGAITNRVDRMAAKGLVERVPDPHDRRSVRIVVTEHGDELIDKIFEGHLANERRMLGALDETSRDQLAGLLRTVLESFGDRVGD